MAALMGPPMEAQTGSQTVLRTASPKEQLTGLRMVRSRAQQMAALMGQPMGSLTV
jgi:hypothetical protein